MAHLNEKAAPEKNASAYFRVARNVDVLGIGYNAVPFRTMIDMVLACPKLADSSNYVVFSSVSSFSTDIRDGYLTALENATICATDGKSLCIGAQKRGAKDAERCCGPDVIQAVFEKGAKLGKRHFLYGCTPETLNRLEKVLMERYPGTIVCGKYSPPFRELTTDEDAAVVEMINGAEPDFVWIGLGGGRQEVWAYNHRDTIRGCTLMAVGAAIDFLAGEKKRAPRWMQKLCLEWLYRLLQEPKRLGKRFLISVPRLLWYFFLDDTGIRRIDIYKIKGVERTLEADTEETHAAARA